MSVIIRKPSATHSWVVRWFEDGKRKEKGFATQKEAKTWKRDHDYEQAHAPKKQIASPLTFGEAFARWDWPATKSGQPRVLSEGTRQTYQSVYTAHLAVLADRALADVADSPEDVAKLIGAMRSCGNARKATALMIVQKVLARHHLALAETPAVAKAAQSRKYRNFRTAGKEQLQVLADGAGLGVWLGFYAGLRACEILAVRREDFNADCTVLRVHCQATRDGKRTVALKDKPEDDYRDIPVAPALAGMVRDLEGRLVPLSYDQLRERFCAARDRAGLPASYTVHSLRHEFGSRMANAGVSVFDLAKWMGHTDPKITMRFYYSQLPSAFDKGRKALESFL